MAGWGDIFGKIAQQFQGRIERLKNEKSVLEKEINELQKINMDIKNPEHREKAARLSVCIDRVAVIQRLLDAKASD